MQQPQSTISQKINKFRVQIRRQKVSKVLALKRVMPQPIKSDQAALQVVIDGLCVLREPQYDAQTLVKVFRTLVDAFKKYEFDDAHENMIKQALLYAMRVFSQNTSYCQTIKQGALELIACLSFNQMYGLTFQSIPFQVLNGFNLHMIKSCLLGLSYLLTYRCQSNFLTQLRWMFCQVTIFKKLLNVIAKFATKQQCFSIIKPLMLNCAVTLCSLFQTYQIFAVQTVQQDFKQLLGFCVHYIQDDIIESANQDPTMNVFFQRFYLPKNILDVHEKTNQLAYPFANYQTLIRIVKQPNQLVLQKLMACLVQQFRGISVQQPLVRCLSKIYYETDSIMPDHIKDEVFAYIFGLQYGLQQHQKQHDQSLRILILMMLNEFVNYQNMNGSIFKYMGDWQHKLWPNTCRLLAVMQYLEKTEDFFTQQKLLELVDCYLGICGRSDVMNECLGELYKFETGAKWLLANGYMVETLDGRMEFMEREEIDQQQQKEWDI